MYYENAFDYEKRKLLKFAFEENVSYANDEIEYNFSKAYSLLYKAVDITNSSEIQKTSDL